MHLVKPPFGRYQDEVVLFLATAAERIHDQWRDPAVVGPGALDQLGDLLEGTIGAQGDLLRSTI